MVKALTLIAWAFVAGACIVAGRVSGASERGASISQAQYNLVRNGSFEEWTALAPNVARRDSVKNLVLIPPNLAPTGWMPAREVRSGQGPTATIARDPKVKHSGAYSVRIENRAMRDITYVSYSKEGFAKRANDPRSIRPNRRYLLRWWVKGKDIEPAGTGPLMMMFYMSQKQGQWSRTNAHERMPVSKETFDWRQRQFVFVTGPHARWATFTFQLRWTTGTVWYDDVELLDRGPVVPVETY